MHIHLLPLWFFIIQIIPVLGFTDYLLKTCAQSGFCNRHRFYEANIKESKNRYYSVDKSSIEYYKEENTHKYVFKASIIKTIPRPDVNDIKVELPFTLSFFEDLTSLRFTIDEIRTNRLTELLPDFLNTYRYNETWKWAFDSEFNLYNSELTYKESNWLSNDIITIFNEDESLKVELYTNSFLLKVYYDNKLSIVINEEQLLNIEHLRSKEENFQQLLPEESSFNMFGDNFEYSKADSLRFGPESVGLDFSFIGYKNVFGIPEHADSLRLKDTSKTEPYRLFNVDVFEYNVDSKMPTYGTIPLMIAANPTSSIGVFWVNAADTWVDINYKEDKISSHWISENGIVDVVLLFSKSVAGITEQFTTLTGKPQLPLLSAIGYHQCRWNYNDEADVLNVDSEMDKAHIPYDFIWLDIEYADSRQYFTWKPNSFATPKKMLKKLENLGRQLVVLLDPHLKVDYFASDKCIENGVAINDKNNKPYIGHCWPGKAIWIDALNPLGKKIWDGLVTVFVDKVKNLHMWNDMNEPSIFDGPETTAPKDLIHFGGWEHRSVHNIYGLSVHESTYESLKSLKSDRDQRPFLLTRAYYAGSQRSAAVWTGDNVANWDYLRISIPMVLTNNIVGFPFIGADVAGFSGNPEPELLVRWYQAGIWYPFFRAHAHIDSKRREPYLFDEPIKSIVRDLIVLRYALLPTLYTSFYNSYISGSPIMKPMFYEKPEFEEFYDVDDQFYIGDSGLLTKPVVAPEQTTVDMKFAPGIYYDYFTLDHFVIKGNSVIEKTIETPLEKSAVFIEGGHILTRKDRYRRSSQLTKYDAYTLLISPNLNGFANGILYVDDGISFEYQNGQYVVSNFTFQDNKITNKVIHSPDELAYDGNMSISKIIIPIGSGKVKYSNVATVKMNSNKIVVNVSISDDKKSIIINNPSLSIDTDWELIL
ncbi:hypothetical protein TPHA_0B02620 [Tetrapisispora phaffii CBS 4417]|uniref:Glucosidase II subunit alpha n=1 Tax=Tetrapisispora phaffii (strain ATCC 24235 / CBS 4417 / NBRC 1672 / NRRL Y-8282 / UCD 70-5) TaxID=1071381 RepID=G8BPK4_TETPH|nr:hypothetical protein TPHA_0B02620 [Tetrapisispora phaffii CBS 4417]CCE61935.1 hypothetical protein TPHA_0B02620 [Tetrapisispora phaffii CBS 4417]